MDLLPPNLRRDGFYELGHKYYGQPVDPVEIELVRDWIRTHLTKGKSKVASSYHLKHVAEEMIPGKAHVANGNMVAGLILEGYSYARHGNNGYFDVKRMGSFGSGRHPVYTKEVPDHFYAKYGEPRPSTEKVLKPFGADQLPSNLYVHGFDNERPSGQELAVERVNRVREYVRAEFTPRASMNRSYLVYNLHRLANCTRGELIAAMILEGFKYSRYQKGNSPDAVFNIAQRKVKGVDYPVFTSTDPEPGSANTLGGELE